MTGEMSDREIIDTLRRMLTRETLKREASDDALAAQTARVQALEAAVMRVEDARREEHRQVWSNSGSDAGLLAAKRESEAAWRALMGLAALSAASSAPAEARES